jgi:hypothetical protein
MCRVSILCVQVSLGGMLSIGYNGILVGSNLVSTVCVISIHRRYRFVSATGVNKVSKKVRVRVNNSDKPMRVRGNRLSKRVKVEGRRVYVSVKVRKKSR